MDLGSHSHDDLGQRHTQRALEQSTGSRDDIGTGGSHMDLVTCGSQARLWRVETDGILGVATTQNPWVSP